ncbi:GNAT family N-acetyltransferase [Arthrobacter agilis]|uniref:GNAT family N-acetyltransferase n=1 Tax=Arthrobacter agilis TaxID=37921 RepID=UPI00278AF0EA|nr:GNAT family N-acetyltransferase [Arthrobacter agilis]MDQ0735817.1 GNAT superfamily N-acetyltransferase [Arthrobacter agilis]
MAITIEQLPIPATLDASGGDFARSAAVSNAVESALWGHDDFRLEVEERLTLMQPTPDRERVLGVAREDGAIVANARLSIPQRDNLRTAYLQIEVLPAHRRRGTATALLAFIEQQAASRGRAVLMSWSDARVDGPDGSGARFLVPPTGAGGFPADDASAVLALRSGFDLVQVDRQSVLELAGLRGSAAAPHGLAALESGAAATAPGRYALLTWTGRCPDHLVEDYALLRRRMSTDPPLGGFAQEEELWDAARIRQTEETALEVGTSSLVCAVRHETTGHLVGHTILERFASRPAVVYQEDTLVLKEHRGHRLGMRLKAANLRRALVEWPDAQRVYTWNAEENTFMLDVNVALGFRPAGRTAGWQKVLP